jgi:host factor-I protein
LAKPYIPKAPKLAATDETKSEPKVIKLIERPIHKKTNDEKTRGVLMTTSTKGNVNIQDHFLNHMRREKFPVTVHMLDGKEIHGHIKSFDNFCIQLESHSSGDTLVYKHGISIITPSKISDDTKKDSFVED